MRYLNANDIKRAICNTQQITFEVTERCNFKCFYCGYGDLYSNRGIRKSLDLDFEKIVSFLSYIKSLWLSNLNDSCNRTISVGFYGGEPLLNIDLIKKTIDYIDKNLLGCGRIFNYTMTTNASLLDKYMDFLVKNDFDLLISLDGNKLNSSYRIFSNGNSSFDVVINNVNKLKQKYPAYFDKNVNFNSVLHNRNSVESLQSFFIKYFNKSVSISELNTSGVNEDKRDLFNSIFKSSEQSLFNANKWNLIEKKLGEESPSYKHAAQFFIRHSKYVYKDYNELLYGKLLRKKNIPTGTCVPFSKKVFITAEGVIMPCERIGLQYSLGKIIDNRVVIKYSSIATKYNKYYAAFEKLCGNCFERDGCTQCMFFVIGFPKGKLLHKNCPGYLSARKYRIYENRQLSFICRSPRYYFEIMTKLKIR